MIFFSFNWVVLRYMFRISGFQVICRKFEKGTHLHTMWCVPLLTVIFLSILKKSLKFVDLCSILIYNKFDIAQKPKFYAMITYSYFIGVL